MSYTPPPHHTIDVAAWKKWIAGFWRHTEESGTWAPTYGGATSDPTNVTYEFQNGLWIRRGSVMHCWFRLGTTTPALTVGSGDLQIKGLPRPHSASFDVWGTMHATAFVGSDSAFNSNKPIFCYLNSGVDYLLLTRDDGVAAAADANYLSTSSGANRIRGYIAYEVDV